MCSHIHYVMQPSPEADHISQNFQANFDRMLRNALEKYHSCPGFTLLLGSILQYRNIKQRLLLFPPGLVASLYLVRQQREGHILDDIGLSGICTPTLRVTGTEEFLAYFVELLENPERSGTHAFDQQSYATAAAKECLELCLCSYHKFSKGATESAHRGKVLMRNKPWAWKARLGVRSRIRRVIRHSTVRQWKSIKARIVDIDQYASLSHNSLMHEYYRFLSYQWRLDLLPIFLEKSALSLELANVLRHRTFTTMAQRFPRRMRLAKQAITTYLLRVGASVVGGS